jgi:hypothetical protein
MIDITMFTFNGANPVNEPASVVFEIVNLDAVLLLFTPDNEDVNVFIPGGIVF